jgi:hypothetical protein
MHPLFPQGMREGAYMKGWIGKTWMGCMVAVALGVPAVHASTSGTITFVGAIVAPTCSMGDAQAAPGRTTGGCGIGPNGQPAHTSLYRQEVVSLESALDSNDRLLNYYAGYAGTSDTKLTIRSYD